MRKAHLPGIQREEDLAESYESRGLFPFWTDTYGNVIAESLASGVPVIVIAGGGPHFLVQQGKSGMVAPSDEDFIR